MSTEKKQMNEWVKTTIEAVIEGLIFGIVLVILKKIGII